MGDRRWLTKHQHTKGNRHQRRQVRNRRYISTPPEDWSARYKLLTGQPSPASNNPRSLRDPREAIPRDWLMYVVHPLSAATRQTCSPCRTLQRWQPPIRGRLSTGKKVNSALDNPVNYFTAVVLSDRASALTDLLDGVSNASRRSSPLRRGLMQSPSVVKQMQSVVTRRSPRHRQPPQAARHPCARHRPLRPPPRARASTTSRWARRSPARPRRPPRAPRAWWASTRQRQPDAAQRGLHHLQVRHRLHRHGERPRQ